MDTVDAEKLEAALEPGLDRLWSIVVAVRVATGLGLEDCALRQSTALAQDQPDPALAFAVAIPGGRVDVIEWTIEGGAHRRQRILFGDAVRKCLGHVSELGASHGNGRNHRAGLAEWNPVDRGHHILLERDCGFMRA